MTKLEIFEPPYTAAEEAELERRALADPDNPPLTAEQLQSGAWKPFREANPNLYANMRARPGRPKSDNSKQAISIRLDQDVLAKFKATGPGWQSRINDVLKAAEV